MLGPKVQFPSCPEPSLSVASFSTCELFLITGFSENQEPYVGFQRLVGLLWEPRALWSSAAGLDCEYAMLTWPPSRGACIVAWANCSGLATFTSGFPAGMAKVREGGEVRSCSAPFLCCCGKTNRGGIALGSSGRTGTFSSSSMHGPYSSGKTVLITSGSYRWKEEFSKMGFDFFFCSAETQ